MLSVADPARPLARESFLRRLSQITRAVQGYPAHKKAPNSLESGPPIPFPQRTAGTIRARELFIDSLMVLIKMILGDRPYAMGV